MVRINGSSRPAPVQKSQSGAKSSASGGKSKASGERVEVSDAAALRAKAKTMMAEMSDVRLERIEEIRDALESGRFTISGKKVATQIVRNALAEHPWK